VSKEQKFHWLLKIVARLQRELRSLNENLTTSFILFLFCFCSPVTYSQSKNKIVKKDFLVTERTAKLTKSRRDKIVLRTLQSCFVDVADVAASIQQLRMKELLNDKEDTCFSSKVYAGQ